MNDDEWIRVSAAVRFVFWIIDAARAPFRRTCGTRYGNRKQYVCGLRRDHVDGHAIEGWQGTISGGWRRL